MSFQIFDTQSTDPYLNLAAEEFLLEYGNSQSRFLFLWQSANAVVLGRNQNPWKECDLDYLQEHSITLARRVSGGGAVFHDLGNLNIALIIPRMEYSNSVLNDIISASLLPLGIQLASSERHDLLLQGRKVSGNAFRLYKDHALLHGTLLVHTDMSHMRSLHSCQHILKSTGIDSQHSDVINLSEVNPDISVEQIKQAIITQLTRQWGNPQPLELTQREIRLIHQKAEYYSSTDWIFGHTPPFECSAHHTSGELRLEVENAYIKRIFHIKQSKLLYEGQPGIPLTGNPEQVLHHWSAVGY